MFLGIDLGTTNVKTVLVDDSGRVVAFGAAPVGVSSLPGGVVRRAGRLARAAGHTECSRAGLPALQTSAGEGVEQDIDEIFAATLSAIAQTARPEQRRQVKAVGISSQGGALQMLDGRGRPVGRVISWLDGRGKSFNESIAREVGPEEFARRTGHPRGTMALGQLLRLRSEQPGVLDKPNQVGLVGDVIVGRLCGRRAHDATSLSCAVLYNPSLDRADPEILRRVGISEDQLPALLSARDSAGGLLADIAQRTSLPAGIPVSPAVHDQYAAALGVGATAPGDVMFGAGTAWVLLAVSERLTAPAAGAGFSCRHVVEGAYGQILSMSNGGSSVTWALKLMGLFAKKGKSSAEIDALLASVPAGAEGLRFWPLLVVGGGAGLKAGTAGRLAGLRLSHGQAHLLRAVVEGLACELARHLRMLTNSGLTAKRLIMCGGAAASSVTPALIADCTGLTVECPSRSQTSAVGAAVIARGLVRRDSTLGELARQAGEQVRVFKPGPQAATYAQLLREHLRSLPLARDGR